MAVIIGMGPHKRSATIEIIKDNETILAAGRYGTDKTGDSEMLRAGRRFGDRVWAVEGCNGIGRHIAPTMVSASYCKAQDPLRHKGYTDSGDDSHRDRR